jgi:hypothetical protein
MTVEDASRYSRGSSRMFERRREFGRNMSHRREGGLFGLTKPDFGFITDVLHGALKEKIEPCQS